MNQNNNIAKNDARNYIEKLANSLSDLSLQVSE